MTAADHPQVTDPLPDASTEADPADLAEQRAAVAVDDDAADDRAVVDDPGEADPADVYEQALGVTSDDEAWAHE